jgi:hypothetical protein
MARTNGDPTTEVVPMVVVPVSLIRRHVELCSWAFSRLPDCALRDEYRQTVADLEAALLTQ